MNDPLPTGTELRGAVEQQLPGMEGCGAVWATPNWIPIIEPLRGLAALAVVLHHVSQAVYRDRTSAVGVLTEWLGAWGVILFFVLSGFCIHLPIARSSAMHGLSVRPAWRAFFMRRAWRILPAYYVAVGLSCALGTWLQTNLVEKPTLISVLSHVLLVHPFVGELFSLNTVFWSIGIEVHFYLVYPVYLAMRERFGSGRILVVSFVFGLASYGLLTVLAGPDPGVKVQLQNLFFVRFWQWCIGAWVADQYCRRIVSASTRALRFDCAPIVWGVLSLALAYLPLYVARLRVGLYLLPFACGALLFSAITSSVSVTGWSRLFGFLGVWSFSLYLTHPLVLGLVLAAVGSGSPGLVGLLTLLLATSLAALLFYGVEQPGYARGRRGLPASH